MLGNRRQLLEPADLERRVALYGAAAVFVLTAFLLLLGLPSFGIVWDEPRGFFQGVFRLLEWFREPSKLEAYWPLPTAASQQTVVFYNHPPLTRYLGALTWIVAHGFLGDVVAMRLAAVLIFSLAASGIFYWVAARHDFLEAAAATLAFITMPRVLAHGFILTADMTLLFAWVAACVLYWEFRYRPRGGWVVGLAYGFVILSKFTGLLWILPVVAFELLTERPPSRMRFWVQALVVALAASWLLNPAWWRHPVEGFLRRHLLLSMSREAYIPITTHYLGHTGLPPWHYVPVMMAITIPVFTLILAAMGIWSVVKERDLDMGGFAFAQLVLLTTFFCLPVAPRYDGVRLFLVVFPWIALLAGRGFALAWSTLEVQAARLAFAAGVALWLAAGALRSHPYELAYYNGLIGGARGALSAGFESTYYWDAVTPAFCRTLNATLPPGAQIQVHPPFPDHFFYLQFAGYLRRDLVFTGDPAPYLLLLSRQGQFLEREWRLFHRAHPIAAVIFDGVPLVQLYRL